MNFFLGLFNRLGCRALLAMLVPIVLAACGGSGAGGQGGASASSLGGVGGTAGQAQIQLTSDKSVLDSNKTTPVQLTAVVVDGNGVVVPTRPVTWQVVDTVTPAGVRLEGVAAKTDAAGKSTASLVLTGDQSNRTINVTVTSGDVSTQLPVTVAGTSIAISGPQTVPLNGSASRFTLNLKDSSGLGIAGKTLVVKSASGNQLSSPSNFITDSSGNAVVDLVGTVGGADIVSASGLGAASGFAIAIATEALQVVPAALDIPIGPTGTTVTVIYAKNGGIAPGSVVNLTSTRGTVSPPSANITSGTANFTISSTTAGPVTLTATVLTTQGSALASFIATVPAAIDLQATPAIVGPNQAGQTSERSTLIAVVRDPDGNPVKGKIVAFTNPVDPSGGTIAPPTSITDESGRATSTFVAGPQSTSPNGVQLRAEVLGTSVTPANASVSVSRSPLFVRLGRGSKIFVDDVTQTYRDVFSVIVTDSTGNAIKNATVQILLSPTNFATGQMCKYNVTTDMCDSSGGTVWRPGPPYNVYPSEDNGIGGPGTSGYRDGVCQAGEDVAPIDRQLTPGNVASASTSVVTNDFGVAGVSVTYPKQMAIWTFYLMEATIKVGGSEGSASSSFQLLALSDDVKNTGDTPAFFNSPYPYTNAQPTCP